VVSRNITKRYDIGFSPATVRNIMSDLEDSGYIDHPHTSAGRIPTDKGYRFYVDSLMDIQKLHSTEVGLINKSLDTSVPETDELLRVASTLLSSITHQIACVTYPRLDSGIFEKIQIMQLTTTRILIVITIKSGLVKTLTLEINSDLKSSQIETVQQLLNERLNGLSFKEIRSTFRERFRDVALEDDQQPILRLFVDSVDKIFKDDERNEKVLITGAKNVIKQPEFENPENFQSVIELIEDKDIIIHILEKSGDQEQVFISIGSENENQKLNEYSFISKKYKLGEISGTLGIVGPKRMEYSKVVAIVDYVARMISEILKNEK
jgi:heat-inducible transcriptional repressor